MDPDATLSELRLLVEALRPALHGAPAIPGVDVGPAERLQSVLDTAGDLADRVEALDASLSAGGRLPCAWARVPEDMTDDEANVWMGQELADVLHDLPPVGHGRFLPGHNTSALRACEALVAHGCAVMEATMLGPGFARTRAGDAEIERHANCKDKDSWKSAI